MNILRPLILIGALLILFTASAVAGNTKFFERAIKAIANSLPAGWTIAEQKSGEIPWGHHWNENYTGPKGLLLNVKGIQSVNAEFLDANGEWRSVHVATESLQIWLMPSNYSDSFWSKFSIDRPIQPTVVVADGPVKVYASPSGLLLSKKDFDEILSKSRGVRWPDSLENNAELLTWKDWQPKLREAIKKEFAKESERPNS